MSQRTTPSAERLSLLAVPVRKGQSSAGQSSGDRLPSLTIDSALPTHLRNSLSVDSSNMRWGQKGRIVFGDNFICGERSSGTDLRISSTSAGRAGKPKQKRTHQIIVPPRRSNYTAGCFGVGNARSITLFSLFAAPS